MDGSDVLRDMEGIAPRVAPFLRPGEAFQVAIQASSRPAVAVQTVAAEVWPFFASKDKFLLVATDQRWFVLESEKEQLRGDLTEHGSFERDIVVETSWFTRFDGFDRPYSVAPWSKLWAAAANDALAAQKAGRPWSLQEAAGRLTEADDDPTASTLGSAVMKIGKFIPRRRGSLD